MAASIHYMYESYLKHTPILTTKAYNSARKTIYKNAKTRFQNAKTDYTSDYFFSDKTFQNISLTAKDFDDMIQSAYSKILDASKTGGKKDYLSSVIDENEFKKVLSTLNKKSLSAAENYSTLKDFHDKISLLNDAILDKDIQKAFMANSQFPTDLFGADTGTSPNLVYLGGARVRLLYETYKETEIDKKKQKTLAQAFTGNVSELIGNLGEGVGLLQMYKLRAQLQKDLAPYGVKMKVINAGDNVEESKRAVGDVAIEFRLNETSDEAKGFLQISSSAKMKNSYDDHFTTTGVTTMRTTSANQINFPSVSSHEVLLNLLSYHRIKDNGWVNVADGEAEGLKNNIMAFRKMMGAKIMTENMMGAFKGDNVYFFNVGAYIIPMEKVLAYWAEDNKQNTPNLNLSSPGDRRKKINTVLNDDKIAKKKNKTKEVAAALDTLSLKITTTFKTASLNNAI